MRIGRESDPRSAFKTTPPPGFVDTRIIDRGWSQCGAGPSGAVRRADGYRMDAEWTRWEAARTTRSMRAANAEDAGFVGGPDGDGVVPSRGRRGSRAVGSGSMPASMSGPRAARTCAERGTPDRQATARAGSDGLHAMERLTGRIGRWNDRNDRGPEIRRTRIAVTAFSQARWCPDTPAAARVVRGPVGRPRAGAAVRLRAALVDGDLRRSADAAARPLGAVVVDGLPCRAFNAGSPDAPRSGTLPAATEQGSRAILMASRPAAALVTCARSCPCGSSCLR